MKAVLITGGSGFIGGHVINALENRGCRLFLLCNLRKTLTPCVRPVGVEWVESQALDDFLMKQELDCVIHLATQYGRTGDQSLDHCNVDLPLKLLHSLGRQGHGLFVNTDSFFSRQGASSKYLSAYVQSKQRFVEVAKEFLSQTSGLKFATLRLEHVFGPCDSADKFIPGLISKLLADDKPIFLSNGRQKRDFIYVEDVARSYLAIMDNFDRLARIQDFDVGTGSMIELRRMIVEIAGACDADPNRLKFGELEMRTGELMESVADTSAISEFGWTASTSRASAVEATVRSVRMTTTT